MFKNLRHLSFVTVTLYSFLIYISFFAFIYIFKINNLILQSEDLVTVVTVPMSILNERNIDLNEYYVLFIRNYPNPDNKNELPYYLREISGNYYSSFPLLTSLIVLPLYIIPYLLNITESLEFFSIMSRVSGAFITALSVGVLYLILTLKNNILLDRQLKNKEVILLLFIYAFCTNSLSMNSQGIWQHGTSNLFLGLGLLFFLKNKFNLSGLLFGFAYIARPTNLLSLVLFGLFILIKPKKRIINTSIFFIFSLIPILIDLLITFIIFGSWFNTGYGSQVNLWTSRFPEGFLGLWLSPSKGLLAVSPIFIFIFYILFKYVKLLNFRKKHISIYILIFIIIIVHTLVLGKWQHWYGGYSWGTRMISDLLIYLVILLIPFINSKYFTYTSYKLIFFVLLLYSFLYQLIGIVVFDGLWHIVFDKGSQNTTWLWSFLDSQIVFSIKRILYKLGIININPFDIE